jgi:hypothetical protein
MDAAIEVGGNDSADVPPVVHTAVLSGSTGTAFAGNPAGGAPVHDACPPGQTVIGFSGAVTVATGTVPSVNRQIATHCGVIQISGTDVTVTPGAMLPTRGMMAPHPWTRTCPAGQVIVGFAGRAGLLVDQVVFSCAPLIAASGAPGAALTPGQATALAPIGGGGGAAFSQITCPTGQIASGSLVRTGDNLDAVSLICSQATIAP